MTSDTVYFAEASLASTTDGFLRADEAAIEMYRSLGPVLEQFNVFVCPTLSIPAPPAAYGQTNNRVICNGQEQNMAGEEWEITRVFNMLSRCPVLSVPSGFAENRVPTGIQIVAKAYHDERVFEAGMAFEQASSWFADPAGCPQITL